MESSLVRVATWLGVLAVAAGCRRPPAENDPGSSYLRDSGFRRSALVASLVNPTNEYSKLRLSAYAVPGGWDALPIWNPSGEVVHADTLGFERPLSPHASPLPIPAGVERDRRALLILGEAAFFRYPVQLAGTAARPLKSLGDAERYGFWRDEERGIGGLVRVALAGGHTGIAYSCATCHAAMEGGQLQVGLANADLDLGRLSIDAATARQGLTTGPNAARAATLAAWGPGRMDVSSADGSEPVRIPDLRAVRLESHLQADGTVIQANEIALAIRLETLIITSHEQAVRPPREIALALAAYLWSLADSLPAQPSRAPEVLRGAQVFETTCAGCHRPPSYSGPPVAIETVGTDPVLGRSRERGTGFYAVPSLRGVGARRALLHDGAVHSLEALLSPERLESSGDTGSAPAPRERGHRFGLTLGEEDRRALLAFLHGL